MEIYTSKQVIGDEVKLFKTHLNHISDVIQVEEEDGVEKSFGKLLMNALKKVNDLQIKSDELTTKMIVSPDEVNIHDVMIAAQKAQLSLNFVKAIRDRVIRAYQEIMNMR